ncbi:V-type ATP synthase subunit D [Candidatus Marsarchaeota archaeon]|nr:V-type ATP synthase subunit D [Candidatus Marsarchaeota archaeon]
MVQQNIKTTRIELIKTKKRVSVAAKGLSLLKLKRASLVLAFFNLARQIQLLRANLGASVQTAMDSTKIADIYAGRINLERIAVEQNGLLVAIEAKNVMGVRIPDLSVEAKEAHSTGYELISVPTAVEDAKKSYTSLFNVLIEIAEKENSLRKLLYEIEKLNRRSNAIENMVIPAMNEKIAYIRQRLEDMERDQIVSLKFIKRKINA